MNPLAHTAGVAIELSNLCDWASIHKYCPLSVQDEVKILPIDSLAIGLPPNEDFSFVSRQFIFSPPFLLLCLNFLTA